jgi:uncharacterized membrane protein
MENRAYRIASPENRERLVEGLGWFSIGLGLVELLAPRALSNFIGVRPQPTLMRFLGLREIANGVGILSQPRRAEWMAARVAGDAMDLLLLGKAFTSKHSDPARLAFATASVAAVTALDVLCTQDLKQGPGSKPDALPASKGTTMLRRALIVNRPAEELYRMWRDFSGLPKFMSHLISVDQVGDNEWHWVAKGPIGSRVEWIAVITEEKANELIAWQSTPNADVDSSGAVRFEPAPGGRGTIVRVQMHYRPPAGKIGARLAKLFGQSPEKQIRVDLLRFKQMAETGEIARTEGQPAGRPHNTSRRFDDLVRA